jgi:hypothetical protein
LFTDNSGVIIPCTVELFSKNRVVGLLFPFSLGNSASKRAIQSRNVPFHSSIEPTFSRLRLCDSIEAVLKIEKKKKKIQTDKQLNRWIGGFESDTYSSG